MEAQHVDELAAVDKSLGRCWCWQYGRCLALSDCPTAAHPRPKPLFDRVWALEATRLMKEARG